MRFYKEFKEFAVRGNVVDMGIGVVIGTAFGKMVNSFVNDIIMPPIGLLLGRVDFSNLYINISGRSYQSLAEAKEAGAATINYGMFFNSIIHFSIVAAATFAAIIQINRIRKVPIESVTSKECPFCFSPIPTRAIKCPKCTSTIDGSPIETKSKNKNDVEIRIKAS